MYLSFVNRQSLLPLWRINRMKLETQEVRQRLNDQGTKGSLDRLCSVSYIKMIGILSCIFALSGAFAKNHHEEPTIWGPYNYDNGEKAIGMGVIEKCVKPGMVALTFDDGVS